MNRKITFFLILGAAVSLKTMAKNLDAHVHGSVNLDIAVDKNQLLVMIKSPAESFLGFEYKPKTKKENKLVQEVKSFWKEDIISSLGKKALKDCKVIESSWQQKFTGKSHSTILAESYIQCKTKLKGRSLQISFKKLYPSIKEIKLQLLREDGSVINEKKTKEIFKIIL